MQLGFHLFAPPPFYIFNLLHFMSPLTAKSFLPLMNCPFSWQGGYNGIKLTVGARHRQEEYQQQKNVNVHHC